MAQARTGTISDLIDQIIGAGPNIGTALEHTVNAVTHFQGCEGISEIRLAVVAITGRSAEPRETDELTADELAKVEELEEQAGESGGRRGLLRDVFAFFKANPELLQLMLLFLKK